MLEHKKRRLEIINGMTLEQRAEADRIRQLALDVVNEVAAMHAAQPKPKPVERHYYGTPCRRFREMDQSEILLRNEEGYEVVTTCYGDVVRRVSR